MTQPDAQTAPERWSYRPGVMFLAIIFPVVFVSVVGFFVVQHLRGDAMRERRIALADYGAMVVSTRFDRLTDLAKSLVLRVRFRELVEVRDWSSAISILDDIPSQFPDVDRILISDLSGKILASTASVDELIGVDHSDHDWYQGVIDSDGAYVSHEVETQLGTREQVVSIAQKVVSKRGTELAIVILQVRVDALFSWLKPLATDLLSSFVIDKNVAVVAAVPALNDSDLTYAETVAAKLRAETAELGVMPQTLQVKTLSGHSIAVAIVPVPFYGWGYVLAERRSGTLYLERPDTQVILIVDTFVFLFTCLLAAFIVRTLKRQRNAEQEVRALNKQLQSESRQALEVSERRYRMVVEDQSELIVRWRPDGTRTFLNNACERFFGKPVTDLIRINHFDMFSPLVPDAFRRQIEALTPDSDTFVFEHDCMCSVGGSVKLSWRNRGLFDAAGKLFEIQSVGTDVTEKRELEASLLQSQRMESLGLLAGGIAHDFNNILGVVLGYAEMGQKIDGISTAVKSVLVKVERAAIRARDLTKQLLAFSRKQVLETRILNLNEEIREFFDTLGSYLGDNIEIHCDLTPQRLSIIADKSQLHQILLNLSINARDAMPRGGVITVTTQSVKQNGISLARGVDLPTGSYAVLAFRDTGVGISPGVVKRIFEPFFTTKDVATGSGLGLATVYGIVKQHGGAVHVQSDLGKGTEFFLYFPESVAAVEGVETQRNGPSATRSRSARLLLVEDEEGIRDMTSEMLRTSGYTVTALASAQEALTLSNLSEFDLLITDVVMPKMSGPELYAELVKTMSSLKVLFMSGYPSDFLVPEAKATGNQSFLSKPFSLDELITHVNDMLGDTTNQDAKGLSSPVH